MSFPVIVATVVALVIAAVALVLVVPQDPFNRDRDERPKPGTADDYETRERASMPEEVARGKLVISERVFYRRGNRPFAAKTDQGFLTEAGHVVLVESKTRRRVSPSDIVQLSCQALAVSADSKSSWRVANYGYIRLAPAGRRPYYQRVDLVHPSRIDQLWDRWHALKHGRIAPIKRPKPYRCETCVIRTRCREGRRA